MQILYDVKMKLEKDKYGNCASKMTFRLPQDENWIGPKFMCDDHSYIREIYIYIYIYNI